MTPVDQTTFGLPGGNCFSACVATLLDLPIDAVPWFNGADDWFGAFNVWLRQYGLYALTFRYKIPISRFPGYYILGGQSPRGSHAVVAKGMDIVHDPNPTRAGLVTREDCTLLIQMVPTVAQTCHAHRGVLFRVIRPQHEGEPEPRYVDADHLYAAETIHFGTVGTEAQRDELATIAAWNATGPARWQSTFQAGTGCCTPGMGLLCARGYYAGFEGNDVRAAWLR